MTPQQARELVAQLETVEITTLGRRSGRPSRIEIWTFAIDGRQIITGTPGPRDWFANILAKPDLTLHLPGGVDVATTAVPVADVEFRRRVFTDEKTWWYRSQRSIEDLVASSPMVELEF